MKYSAKRWIAILLTLIMFVNIMPMSALAEDSYIYEYGETMKDSVDSKNAGDRSSSSFTIHFQIESGLNLGNLVVIAEQNNRYYWEEVGDKTTITVSQFHAPNAGGDPSKISDYDDLSDIEVFLAYGPDYGQGPQEYQDYMLVDTGTYYHNNETINGKKVSITYGTDTATVKIGDAVPISYTASITDWPSGSTAGTYRVIAKVDNVLYYAPIAEDGTVGAFCLASDNTQTEDGKLPGIADSGTIGIADASNTPISNNTLTVNGIDYQVTYPASPQDQNYAFSVTSMAGKDVFVTIQKAEGSPDIPALPGMYYLVVGWHDGDDSYDYVPLDNTLVGGPYSFDTQSLIQENKPHDSYDDLFIMLKQYDNAADPRPFGGEVFIGNKGVSDNPHQETIDGNQYTFTISGPTVINEKQHYTITVEKQKPLDHTVTWAAEDGVDTTYYCTVLKWNINGQDYYAFAEFGNGTPQTFSTLENQNGTIAYDQTVPVAEAFIITGDQYSHNYREMLTWGNDWRKYNGQAIDGKLVQIDIKTSKTTTTVTIGEVAEPTYSVSLSFTEGGEATTPTDLDSGYYLVAKDEDNNIYYAPVTSAGIGNFV